MKLTERYQQAKTGYDEAVAEKERIQERLSEVKQRMRRLPDAATADTDALEDAEMRRAALRKLQDQLAYQLQRQDMVIGVADDRLETAQRELSHAQQVLERTEQALQDWPEDLVAELDAGIDRLRNLSERLPVNSRGRFNEAILLLAGSYSQAHDLHRRRERARRALDM